MKHTPQNFNLLKEELKTAKMYAELAEARFKEAYFAVQLKELIAKNPDMFPPVDKEEKSENQTQSISSENIA